MWYQNPKNLVFGPRPLPPITLNGANTGHFSLVALSPKLVYELPACRKLRFQIAYLLHGSWIKPWYISQEIFPFLIHWKCWKKSNLKWIQVRAQRWGVILWTYSFKSLINGRYFPIPNISMKTQIICRCVKK